MMRIKHLFLGFLLTASTMLFAVTQGTVLSYVSEKASVVVFVDLKELYGCRMLDALAKLSGTSIDDELKKFGISRQEINGKAAFSMEQSLGGIQLRGILITENGYAEKSVSAVAASRIPEQNIRLTKTTAVKDCKTWNISLKSNVLNTHDLPSCARLVLLDSDRIEFEFSSTGTFHNDLLTPNAYSSMAFINEPGAVFLIFLDGKSGTAALQNGVAADSGFQRMYVRGFSVPDGIKVAITASCASRREADNLKRNLLHSARSMGGTGFTAESRDYGTAFQVSASFSVHPDSLTRSVVPANKK